MNNIATYHTSLYFDVKVPSAVLQYYDNWLIHNFRALDSAVSVKQMTRFYIGLFICKYSRLLPGKDDISLIIDYRAIPEVYMNSPPGIT